MYTAEAYKEQALIQEADRTPEVHNLCAGLDFYKPTMSQLAFEKEPNAEVTFTFHNRGSQRLLEYVDPFALQEKFDLIREKGFSEEELDYLSALTNSDGEHVFSGQYINYLRDNELPPVHIGYDAEKDDMTIGTTGSWTMSTFWETVVMSEVNEAYFEGYLEKNGVDQDKLYDEGLRRLEDKIEILNANPNIKFADFGTRRHFSSKWHGFVLDTLAERCPNYIGTSNVEFSAKLGTRPIGTFAHEMPMVYAALAESRGEDVRASHGKFLDDWKEVYGKDYLIALTDTFGTEFFFSDFTKEQAEEWNGLRQDSGDPYEFGERAIKFYENNGIDPKSKTIVFSDGLDIDAILSLQKAFEGRLKVLFGWGTTLTNDLGIKPLNIVMKATHAKDTASGLEADTVKLSDDIGKHTGPLMLVNRYSGEYFNTERN
jgi:nicotinate phosphoribosyltransferase